MKYCHRSFALSAADQLAIERWKKLNLKLSYYPLKSEPDVYGGAGAVVARIIIVLDAPDGFDDSDDGDNGVYDEIANKDDNDGLWPNFENLSFMAKTCCKTMGNVHCLHARQTAAFTHSHIYSVTTMYSLL